VALGGPGDLRIRLGRCRLLDAAAVWAHAVLSALGLRRNEASNPFGALASAPDLVSKTCASEARRDRRDHARGSGAPRSVTQKGMAVSEVLHGLHTHCQAWQVQSVLLGRGGVVSFS
jgi:hypothetical protein